MKAEYDFSNARKNPYSNRLKKQITINLDANTIDYFKNMAAKSGIPYQTLINLYLTDCATNNRQLKTSWQLGIAESLKTPLLPVVYNIVLTTYWFDGIILMHLKVLWSYPLHLPIDNRPNDKAAVSDSGFVVFCVELRGLPAAAA